MTIQKNSRKKVLVIALCIALVLVIASVLALILVNKKDRAFSVGFYQVPELIASNLEKKISQTYGENIKFIQIEDEQLSEKKFYSKFDIIFCLNGSFVDGLEKYTKKIPAGIYGNMPRAITDKTQVSLPILLDHYELAFYRPSRMNALNMPQSLDELQEYLEKSKKNVFSPFFCAGGDDNTLLALVSAFTEAYGGTAAYNELCEALKKEKTLKSVAETKLPLSSSTAKYFTIIDILDIFRSWKDNEMVHPDWFHASLNDVKVFMEEKQIAVVFMPLSFHRTISYRVIRDFESDRLPLRSSKDNHGLIAPEYVAIKLSNEELCDTIFADLIEEVTQTNLSDQTKLAPVNSRCAAFDRQSDDVRFFAAACKDGPLPSISEAVFQTSRAELHPFAEEIREYLRTGRLN